MHNFKDWPSQHRNLLLIVLFIVIACAAATYIRLYPLWVEYTELRDEKESIEAKLLKSEWPKEPGRLNGYLQNFTKRLEGTEKNKRSKAKTNDKANDKDKDKDNGDVADNENEKDKGLVAETAEVIKNATSMFNKRIDNEYESTAVVIQKASQTDYKDQFNTLDNYLEGKGINIDNTVFGMSETTTEPLKYQMLLKLWTVKEIVDCAIDAKMIVINRPSPSGQGKRVGMITVKPMQSYYINANDAEPYLLEFPVYIELIGTLENFSKFTDSLFSEGRFLAMSQIELTANPPSLRNPPKPNKDGDIYSKIITARITCSSFFLPQTPPQKNTAPSSKDTGRPTERPVGI